MTCSDCQTAKVRFHHIFQDCPGCRARAIARSPQFSKAWKAKRQHPEYRSLLEHIGVTHEQAVEAARNDRACDRLMASAQKEPVT
jgi:hypothetical protein